MSRPITDPEVRLLVTIAQTLKADYVRVQAEDPWADSPFAWIRALPSRQVGKIGEQLVAGWCAAKGMQVAPGGDSEADCIVNDCRIEVKFSTLWRSGVYKFQQIRDQDYEYLACLGVSPFDVHCWVIPKDVLRQHVIGHTPQHTGKRGTDTSWLSVVVQHPQSWLSRWGGTLGEASRILMSIRRK